MTGFPRKLSRCELYIDAHDTHSNAAVLFEDFMLPVPQSDLSRWRVSASQKLLRWKDKQHMLEMQTRVVTFITRTADENEIQNDPLYIVSLTMFMHSKRKCDITTLLIRTEREISKQQKACHFPGSE